MATEAVINAKSEMSKNLSSTKSKNVYNNGLLKIFGNNYVVLTNGYVTLNGVLTSMPSIGDSAEWEDSKNPNMLVNLIIEKLDSIMNTDLTQEIAYATGTTKSPLYKTNNTTGKVYNGNSHFEFSLNFVVPNKRKDGKVVGLIAEQDNLSSGYDFEKVMAEYGSINKNSDYSFDKNVETTVQMVNNSVIHIADVINEAETAAFNSKGFVNTVTNTLGSIYDSTLGENNNALGGGEDTRVTINNVYRPFTGTYLWYLYLMLGIFKKPFVCVIEKWKIKHSDEVYMIGKEVYSSYSTIDLTLSCDRVLTMEQFKNKLN